MLGLQDDVSKPDTPLIDLRTVDKAGLPGVSFTVRDYALLALLRLNDRESITHLTYMQYCMYLAQVGGLYRSRHYDGDIQPVPDYFEFDSYRGGDIWSEPLEARLDALADMGVIEPVFHPHRNPTDSNDGRTEYAITDAGADILTDAEGFFSKAEVRTLKLVKTIYTDVPLLQLADEVKADYATREANAHL